MDMSSFPKMLQFKQKMVPHQQLLRWSEWFSKYDFDCVYLKGTKNILADMLSRKPLEEIHMMASSSTAVGKYYDFNANIPEDAHHFTNMKAFHEHSKQKIFKYQSIILSKYGVNCHYIAPMGIHPDYPFAHLYRITSTDMPEEVLCFLWYLCSIYTIGITFDIKWLYQFINSRQGQKDCFSTFLTWFAPLTSWSGKLRRSARTVGLTMKKLKEGGGLNPFFNPHTIYFFHRPVQVNEKTNKIHALSTLIHHNDYKKGIRPDFNIRDNKPYEDFQIHAFRLNNATQTFAIPFDHSWTYYSVDYQMSLDEDLQFFEDQKNKRFSQLKQVKTEPSPDTCPPEYFQDAQPLDDSMNIDEVGTMYGLNTTEAQNNIEDFEDPEDKYVCPDDHYGCCEEHMLEFEMDH